jgi:hypothetical protein
MKTLGNAAVDALAAAGAGMTAFVLPVLADPPRLWPSAPLFPVVREAVEHPRPAAFLGLAVIGLVAGLAGRAPWALLGLASMALFPVCTMAEIAADGRSHNLFPLEFVMYAVYALPAVGGAAAGRTVRRLVRREPRTA